MRTFVGIIFGVFLAIGVAYVHDTSLSTTDRERRAIVNWDAFGTTVRDARENITAMWDRLTEGAEKVSEQAKRKS